MSPTDPATMFLFYPDWSPGGAGCLNDGDHPPYMAANPSGYLFSTSASCCSQHFGWNYDACIGAGLGICARALFYPDWGGADEGCLDDGNEPPYMTDNAMYYMFSQLADCCQEHYGWNYDTCIGASSNVNNGQYYPDFSNTDHVCRNDGAQPPYMNNSPSHWMHDTLAECCNTNYLWNYNNCIGSPGATSTSGSTSTSGLYYPDWLGSDNVCSNDGGQPPYMTQNPDAWMHTTLKSCCQTNFGWNYDNCIGATTGR